MLQYMIAGLAYGSLYALLALGLVLTFRSTNVLNFAQGEVSMLMAFVCYSVVVTFGLGIWTSISLAIFAAALFGVVLYNFFIYPFRKRDHEALAIISLALKLVITGAAALYWGPDAKVFPSLFGSHQIVLAGTSMSPNQVAIIAAGMISVTAIAVFLRYTSLGLSMRIAAENPDVAQLLGINLRVVGSTAWAAAAMLGAVTGVVVAATVFLSPYMMGLVIMKGFAALVLGGMSSPVGAVAGGLMLGLLESLVAYSISPLFQDSIGLLLMIAILLIRPEGIFRTAGNWRA